MTAKPMTRLVHQAFPYRNELATTGDRIEGVMLALGVAVSLIAIPVAGATGSETYANDRARVAVEQVSKQHVEAFLIEDAPITIGSAARGGVVESAPVLARWRLRDGTTREGVVQAHYDAKSGARVPVWIDESGRVTEPPMTSEGAAVNAIILAFLLWSAVTGAMALLYLATRFTHKRIRLRQWANEWRRIAPDWTGR
ncbi:Rv1733c family protein [Lentzea nigeriaca]|uniref:Rv1733c family protein n=1 Tax=Lentzea nigeriaca TaxID=1128665 RepID=UPI00195A8C1A|nr:hypothetical protein [Lentzea nigeriaca]MBM7863741.1 hypothetical protein [Lentzea nigeriaca]